MSDLNFQTLALWAAVIITILGAVGTLITRSLNGRIDDLKTEQEKAESRIKENAKLAIDPVSRAVVEAKELVDRQRSEDLKRIERLEDIYDSMNVIEPRKRS